MTETHAYSEDDVILAITEHLEISVWRYPAPGDTVGLDARFAESTTTEHAGTTPHGDQAAKETASSATSPRASPASRVPRPTHPVPRSRACGTHDNPRGGRVQSKVSDVPPEGQETSGRPYPVRGCRSPTPQRGASHVPCVRTRP